MKDRLREKLCNNVWSSDLYTKEEREIAEESINVKWDSLKIPILKQIFLYAAASVLSREHIEEREERIEEKRFDRLEKITLEVEGMRLDEKRREFDAYIGFQEKKLQHQVDIANKALGIEAVKVKAMIGLAKEYIETQRIQSKYGGLERSVGVERQLPESSSRSDYFISAQCVLGNVGPQDAVREKIEAGVHYQQCKIAEMAHKRSVLGIHLINSPRLREAGCPLPYSRGLRRFVKGWFPPAAHSSCDLADGKWYKKEGPK